MFAYREFRPKIFLFFPSLVDQEDQIIKLLTTGYQKDKLYLPPRKLGETLPTSLYEFNQNIVEEIMKKIMDERYSEDRASPQGLSPRKSR